MSIANSAPDLRRLPGILSAVARIHEPELAPSGLTSEELLEHYRRIQHVLTDAVRDVARGILTGVFVTGRPGTGKTTAIRQTLRELEVNTVWRSGYASTKATFDVFKKNENAVIVFDDIPALLKSDNTKSLLMDATDGKRSETRSIPYATSNKPDSAEFTGGIIAISNKPLGQDATSRALASRLTEVVFEPTQDQLLAYMRSLAELGHPADGALPALEPQETLAVFEAVVEASLESKRQVDLRAYGRGVGFFISSKLGNAHTHWAIRLRHSLQRVEADDLPQSREQRLAVDREIAAEIRDSGLAGKQAAEEFAKRTGRAKTAYYDRLKEWDAQ